MASFLDTGLLGLFSSIFTFLLIYAIIYGVLITRKPFKESTGLYAVISFAGAFFMVLSPLARAFVEFVTPWFLVLAVVFFFIVISISIFTEVNWLDVITYPATKTWLTIIIALVVVGGLAAVFGQMTLEKQIGPQTPVTNENGDIVNAGGQVGQGGTATGSYETNLINTIVHPKVLGILLIFGLSALIIYFLSQPAGGL